MESRGNKTLAMVVAMTLLPVSVICWVLVFCKDSWLQAVIPTAPPPLSSPGLGNCLHTFSVTKLRGDNILFGSHSNHLAKGKMNGSCLYVIQKYPCQNATQAQTSTLWYAIITLSSQRKVQIGVRLPKPFSVLCFLLSVMCVCKWISRREFSSYASCIYER